MSLAIAPSIANTHTDRNHRGLSFFAANDSAIKRAGGLRETLNHGAIVLQIEKMRILLHPARRRDGPHT